MRRALAWMALPLLVFSTTQCGENAPRQDDSADRQAQIDRLLATYDQEFIGYLARAREAMGREVLSYTPISSDLTIPKRMDISGSHYDYGYLVGHIAQQHGRRPPLVLTQRAEAGIDDLGEMAAVMGPIRSPAGYMSLFDIKSRFMRLYLRRDFDTASDFAAPW